MEESRKISGNTCGNDNIFVQGNATINRPAEGSQRQEENDILKRLYTSPYQDRKDRNPKRVPGTCDWFVSHEHFRTWNESNSSALLWVSADPGCGKSVLVRHLVDSVIPTTESRIVCYFFFKNDFPDQKNIISALSCILRQIFIQNPSLLSKEILKRFNSGGETFTTSFSELWQTLIQVAGAKNAGEIVCLLDAIDECEDQNDRGRCELLKALCALYGTETRRRANLKFLLTSRPYAGIYRSLQPIQLPGLPVIHLSGESEEEIKKISLEINIYINARVKDVGDRLHLSQAECDLLLEKLMHVPNRTYLWVYLVLDFIENSIEVNNMMIIEATSNMPTTVNESYERILSKSSNAIQARRALHIIVAAARPLTLREMNFALTLDGGDHKSYDDLDLLPHDRFHETLRSICGLCVVVVDSKVYLLHQTVKEFLVEGEFVQIIQTGCEGHNWNYSFEPQESHRILAEVCIWHLRSGLEMESSSLTQNNWRSVFLDYSAKHWASHFRQTTPETQSMMTELILRICDASTICCQTWFSSYWTTTNTEIPISFTTLMMASYFGLHFAVSSLLTMADIELDNQDGTYQRSALSWAVRNGYYIVSELLLKGICYKLGTFRLPFRKTATVDLQDRYGRAPLTYAVWNADINLVRLLTKAGAQVDLRDRLEVTPLTYAFVNGDHKIINLLAKRKRGVNISANIGNLLLSAAEEEHAEVMSLLFKTKRANIDVRNPNGQTSLMKASLHGREAIVKLLLEAGADVNARDDQGDTALTIAGKKCQWPIVELLIDAGADVSVYGDMALMKASMHGRKAIVKLLLEAGADVNARDDQGDTALIYASRNNRKAIVKLIIRAGADVNAYSKGAETALTAASEEGHEVIANLLLEAGADVNFYGKSGYTALMRASFEGHEATVKLLLKAGADVNARDQYCRTALILASHDSRKTIAKLLLEAGANPIMKR